MYKNYIILKQEEKERNMGIKLDESKWSDLFYSALLSETEQWLTSYKNPCK
jgi:hypothetical protein